MVIAGVLIGAEPRRCRRSSAVEEDFGWMLVLLGALVALAAHGAAGVALAPGQAQRRLESTTTDGPVAAH